MRWESLHNHDHFGNTLKIESACTTEDFARKQKELGMSSLCITNHGTVVGWFDRWFIAKKNGLKYIHGVEAYITFDKSTKIRDNYHCILLAKNIKGFREINRLMSQAHRRDANDYYYDPRISAEELINTSDDIIILTACLGGILAKPQERGEKDVFKKFFNFCVKNKHRIYLEVQPHNDPRQIEWNKISLKLSKAYDLKLVGTLDAHATSKDKDETRKILKEAKNSNFGEEDAFECWLKPRDEVFERFMEHGVFTESEINSLLNVTGEIVDNIDELIFNTDIKYPEMSNDPESEFKKLVREGYIEKGIDKFESDKKKKYDEQLGNELETYKQLHQYDYLLLDKELVDEAKKQDITIGPGRGSLTGSLALYLTGQHYIDPIVNDLSFERFANRKRYAIGDKIIKETLIEIALFML